MQESFPRSAMLGRRQLLQLGVLAGVSAGLAPRLAWAAGEAQPLPQVAAMLERWTGPGKLPGLVAGLGLPGQPTRFIARGTEAFTDRDKMTADSLFRIYSMTKPITGFATMMLIEDGKLGLDQPLAEILPKFARMQVQVTPDGSLTQVRPARTPITIRHLLTHTAGLGYTVIQKGPIKAAYEQQGLVVGRVSRKAIPLLDRGKPAPSLEAFADRLAEMPLVYEPGTTWSYSVGLDLLGRVIEVVSGKAFDRFLHQRLFEPLGMTSTWFQVPAAEARRLTANHAVIDGKIVTVDPGEESVYLDKPPFPFGGSGLVSSPRDYDRFLRMLANFGTLDGKRVMGELAVRVGTGNLLPDGVAGPAMMGPPSLFGAGGMVGMGDQAGIFGWGGAAGTLGSVDMRRGITTSLFVQYMLPDDLPVQKEYRAALQADLASLRPASA